MLIMNVSLEPRSCAFGVLNSNYTAATLVHFWMHLHALCLTTRVFAGTGCVRGKLLS